MCTFPGPPVLKQISVPLPSPPETKDAAVCRMLLLSYCLTSLLSYCLTSLLSYCHTPLPCYCRTSLLSYCRMLFLNYCFTLLLSNSFIILRYAITFGHRSLLSLCHGIQLPDLVHVLLDRTVGRELACAGRIHHSHARPSLVIAISLLNSLLRFRV